MTSDMKKLIDLCNKEFPGFQGAAFFHIKNGTPVCTPIMPAGNDFKAVDLITKLLQWSDGLKYMANDMTAKLHQQGRQN